MISLRMPSPSMSSCSSGRKRSSTVISGLLDVDGALGAVGRGQPGRALLISGHQAVTEDLPVPLLVGAEQLRREVVTAAVPLAELGVDPYLHPCPPNSPHGISAASARPPPGPAGRPTPAPRRRSGPA